MSSPPVNSAPVVVVLICGGESSQPATSTLNKLLTELRSRNFVNEHRLSMQIGGKRAKKTRVLYANVRIFQLSLHFYIPPLVVGLV